MNVKLRGRAPIIIVLSFVTMAFAILSSVSTPTYSSVEEKKFWAGLEGEFEVPPTSTNASGIVMLKNTQDSIWYMINVTDIDNVTAAHIHSGILGENGPIVATLFDVDVPIENVNGTLAQGNHTANMLEGPLLGKQLTDLTMNMQNNTTYVNIHSTDYPDGEIRGQIMSADSTHVEIMMN
jgi:CHRD domain